MNTKLAIISTHLIQYNAPFFKMLTRRGNVDLKVFYTWSQAKEKVEDKDFGKDISWDIPLLVGYEYEFIHNVSKSPGNRSFKGIINPDLVSKIEGYDPQAIMVFGWNFQSHLKVLRYFKGKRPVWFRGDSHLLDETKGIKTFLRRKLLKWVFSHVDKAFYVGTNNKDYFIKHGLKENQLVFAPHAIDNQRFCDSKEKEYENRANEWRNELGFHQDDIVILFSGKFEPKKDPALLVNAVKKLNQTTERAVKLIMVGNGVLENELKRMGKKDPNICFIPFQNQSIMPVVYRLGDVFCLPSKGPGETWGLAINEAMACGRPVIASDKVGGAIDLIKEGENGFIFRSNDLEALKGKINLIFNNNEILNQMSEKSHSIIQDFNYQKICQVIEDQLGE